METRVSIETLAQLNYLVPEKARFYVENDHFLCLEYDGEVYTNLKLHRSLPFKLPDDYISVQDMEGKELFLIRSLYELSDQQAKLLGGELKKRYYYPVVLSIPSLKAKMGFLYFEVVTSAGRKIFALRDVTRNLRRIDDGTRVMITDVDGNRYMIEDIGRISRADFKRIEPYLL